VLPASGAETQITATIHVAPGNDALARQTAQNIHLESNGGRWSCAIPMKGEICALPVAASRIPVRTPRTLAVASTRNRIDTRQGWFDLSCASLQTAT